ncbi:Oidioi.mRNA.OKI2018_I69.chr2.g4027.t2.cds [Oikopleura dioica]|uniref:Oidioi.mRNA.OKI2018_I69.chr2.g4027.t2.cds n=1 Tax=Oikopleura dioica TaxID=34765 RepID=A0ABN7SW09_OIKDI|nr:Oidioi.mRNA.OKI2018_I69.chr2.g4027.t2.cds [Oikopleura dioica]
MVKKAETLKTHFKTREGVYEKDYNYNQEDSHQNASMLVALPRNIVTVDSVSYVPDLSKLSLKEVHPDDPQSIVFCTGKEVYHYNFHHDTNPRHKDKRIYKGSALPSTLSICPADASEDHVKIAIGFTAGQIQIVDMATSDESKRSIAKINDERNHDNSVINSIQWLPGSSEILIAAFNSGDLFAFHRDYPDAVAPVNWSHKKDASVPFIEFDSKNSKEKENPLRKWSFGKAAISAIQFSPDGGKLAIASRNGKCYVVKVSVSYDYQISFEYICAVSSFFGGFLCCSWSPSGRFLAAGGEDDSITVLNVETRKPICRCQGHRSWVSSIAWDTFVAASSAGIDARLGSVGHDGILCLWDLTGDVMFPKRTRTFSETERNPAPKHVNSSELPIIEPMVEKKISNERLTYIFFHLSCFIIASQNGSVIKWIRPHGKIFFAPFSQEKSF